MSGYPIGGRQGKGTIVAGVAMIAAGFVVQGLNVYSFASQPPQVFSGNSFGRAEGIVEVAGLLILCGIVTTIVGIIRYAQSGRAPLALAGSTPVERPIATPGARPPGFCSTCGSPIAGAGRFCSSCGASTGR